VVPRRRDRGVNVIEVDLKRKTQYCGATVLRACESKEEGDFERAQGKRDRRRLSGANNRLLVMCRLHGYERERPWTLDGCAAPLVSGVQRQFSCRRSGDGLVLISSISSKLMLCNIPRYFLLAVRNSLLNAYKALQRLSLNRLRSFDTPILRLNFKFLLETSYTPLCRSPNQTA
jgi:hypothetical protein